MSALPPASEKPPRPAFGMYKRFAAAFAIIVALAAGATATAGLLEVQDVVDILNEGPKLDVGNQLTEADAGQAQTLLLFGSDHRFTDAKGVSARSDTIMLVRLNPHKHIVTVLSIPRDLKVNITLPNGSVIPDKINAAYSLGGPKLATAAVKALLHIPIHHVVNINFHFFQKAVNYIGCVYMDVDRRYYHVSGPGAANYASIDIPAGYQKLCGKDSLDFVRYRHTDSDLVRASRQHDFLRAAKEQSVQRGLANVDKIKTLAKLLAHYTQTDIRSNSAIIRLLKLAIFSTGQPVQTVDFPAETGGPDSQYVTASPEAIQQAVREFLDPDLDKPRKVKKRSASGRRHRQSRRASSSIPGLMDAGKSTEDLAVLATNQRPGFRVYYPQQVASQGHIYGSQGPNDPNPRVYKLFDEQHHKHHAYRMVFTYNGLLGQYYGVQGTDWTDPPILANPSETVERGGRRLQLFYDGRRLRIVALRVKGAVYWVSNTLGNRLSNQQMIGIATSLSDRFR